MEIVSLEGDLEYPWDSDSEMSWCIHVAVQPTSGMTQQSIMESCNTQVSFPPQKQFDAKTVSLWDGGCKEGGKRACPYHPGPVPLSLPFSSSFGHLVALSHLQVSSTKSV